jgi:hypothetical protein
MKHEIMQGVPADIVDLSELRMDPEKKFIPVMSVSQVKKAYNALYGKKKKSNKLLVATSVVAPVSIMVGFGSLIDAWQLAIPLIMSSPVIAGYIAFRTMDGGPIRKYIKNYSAINRTTGCLMKTWLKERYEIQVNEYMLLKAKINQHVSQGDDVSILFQDIRGKKYVLTGNGVEGYLVGLPSTIKGPIQDLNKLPTKFGLVSSMVDKKGQKLVSEIDDMLKQLASFPVPSVMIRRINAAIDVAHRSFLNDGDNFGKAVCVIHEELLAAKAEVKEQLAHKTTELTVGAHDEVESAA